MGGTPLQNLGGAQDFVHEELVENLLYAIETKAETPRTARLLHILGVDENQVSAMRRYVSEVSIWRDAKGAMPRMCWAFPERERGEDLYDRHIAKFAEIASAGLKEAFGATLDIAKGSFFTQLEQFAEKHINRAIMDLRASFVEPEYHEASPDSGARGVGCFFVNGPMAGFTNRDAETHDRELTRLAGLDWQTGDGPTAQQWVKDAVDKIKQYVDENGLPNLTPTDLFRMRGSIENVRAALKMYLGRAYSF